MYKVMIVDDEISVLESLEATLPWDRLEVETVSTATSVDEAIAEMRRQPADLIITDIRMPGKTGLELIQMVKKHWTKTRCILISAYSDFEYAKKAIQNGADDYLLKPVRDEDMILAIQNGFKQLETEWSLIHSHQRVVQTLNENLSSLQSMFLNELLQGRKLSLEGLARKLDTLQIHFSLHRPSLMLLIRMETDESQNDFQLMQYAVMNMAAEILDPTFEQWICTDVHDYLVVLVQQKLLSAPVADEQAGDVVEAVALLQSLAIQLQNCVMQYLKFSISSVVSNECTFPDELPQIYQESLKAIRHAGNDKGLFLYLQEEPDPFHMMTLKSLYEPPLLLHLLEASRWEAAKDKLQTIFDELSATGHRQEELLLEVFLHISHAYSYIAHKQGRLLSDIIETDYEVFTARPLLSSLLQLSVWSARVLDKISMEISSVNKHSRNRSVLQVQEYVQQHLSEDISLQTLADHVHLHPVYVSRIFKMEMGEKLSDYILRLKMEHASRLLLNSDLKVYEIAIRLGYLNAPYFIQLFKKYYGNTPNEYREHADTSPS